MNITELKELAEKATPGPWLHEKENVHTGGVCSVNQGGEPWFEVWSPNWMDAPAQNNEADAAYFNERPHLADDNGIRVFDAGFDRGWDAACAERDARIAELERLRSEDHSHALDLAAEIERMTQQLEEVRLKSTVDASEFNRAIDFAIDQGSEAMHFLTAWREGDTADWPEFAAAIKEQT